MIYAGVLAAGLGERMHGQDMPKQFLPLGDKPIIIHTLEQFFVNQSVDRIIIVAPNDWLQYTEDLLAKYKLTNKEYVIIRGGVNKTESISMIAHYVDEKFGIDNGDLLIAYDAICPFITQRLINDHIKVASRCAGVNTAMNTNDAILVSQDGLKLDSVPLHEHLYAEQTPQSYALPNLKEMLQIAKNKNIILSHENELSRLWIKLGYEMKLVRGEYFNMKIINPYDLEVANALLKERKI